MANFHQKNPRVFQAYLEGGNPTWNPTNRLLDPRFPFISTGDLGPETWGF